MLSVMPQPVQLWDAEGNRIDQASAGRTPVLGPIRNVHQWFLITAWLAFIGSTTIMNRPQMFALQIVLFSICLLGNVLSWVARRYALVRSLRITFADREQLVGRVSAAMEHAGFALVHRGGSGLDFGPKASFWSRLLGDSPVVMDFPKENMATINGPQGILKQIRSVVGEEWPITNIGVANTREAEAFVIANGR